MQIILSHASHFESCMFVCEQKKNNCTYRPACCAAGKKSVNLAVHEICQGAGFESVGVLECVTDPSPIATSKTEVSCLICRGRRRRLTAATRLPSRTQHLSVTNQVGRTEGTEGERQTRTPHGPLRGIQGCPWISPNSS